MVRDRRRWRRLQHDLGGGQRFALSDDLGDLEQAGHPGDPAAAEPTTDLFQRVADPEFIGAGQGRIDLELVAGANAAVVVETGADPDDRCVAEPVELVDRGRLLGLATTDHEHLGFVRSRGLHDGVTHDRVAGGDDRADARGPVARHRDGRLEHPDRIQSIHRSLVGHEHDAGLARIPTRHERHGLRQQAEPLHDLRVHHATVEGGRRVR